MISNVFCLIYCGIVPKYSCFQGMRKRDEELAKEVELLKQKLEEIDQMARGRGLAGVFNIKYAHAEEVKPVTAA